MTAITLYRTGDFYRGFEIDGHADSGRSGEDIVCAAISILGITAENSLELICGLDDNEKNLKTRDGYIYLCPEEYEGVEIQTILKMFKIGIDNIAEQYPQYVKLKMEEYK